MVLAIDFDNTIADSRHPIPGRKMGPPMPKAKESLLQLIENGHTIIVHTIWTPDRHHVIAEWMGYYGIPYHSITNVKPDASCYIDDKAIPFTSWDNLMNDII